MIGVTRAMVVQVLARATRQLRAVSETPRLDAELLLGHVLGWSRAQLLARGSDWLSEQDDAVFQGLIARRIALEPVAYLVGHREFYGLDFMVDRRVLVPRPETELVVELALGVVQRMGLMGSSGLRIADVGTGSGALAVALAVQLPGASVYAIDISRDALDVARLNAARHGVADRVQLVMGDLLEGLPAPVELIVSNPPYTVLAEVSEGVRRHEPHLALDGGVDGLMVYRRLLAQAPMWLRPAGVLLLEIGAQQGSAVQDLARMAFPDARIACYADLAGFDRVVLVAL